LPTRHLVQGQIGGVAPIAEGDHVTGGGFDLREMNPSLMFSPPELFSLSHTIH
jgi:hypothetical protein